MPSLREQLVFCYYVTLDLSVFKVFIGTANSHPLFRVHLFLNYDWSSLQTVDAMMFFSAYHSLVWRSGYSALIQGSFVLN